MKKIIIISALFFAINFVFSSGVKASTLFFSDGFETNTGAWGKAAVPGVISTDVAHSGSHSMKFVHTQSVGMHHDFSGIPEFYSE